MKKETIIKFFGGLCLTGLILTSGCGSKQSSTRGFLEGVISIGPICPVERIPPDPACQPTAETYKAYPVSIYTSDGSRKIAQLKPSLDGSYFSELPSGNYLVVLEKPQNNIGGSNLPSEISINADNTTIFNINIDTGIR
jgi:hypothetical protein